MAQSKGSEFKLQYPPPKKIKEVVRTSMQAVTTASISGSAQGKYVINHRFHLLPKE
jgi:hypothetical protein